MSKSDPSDASRINLDDTPDSIRLKIRKSVVDSHRGITYDPTNRPGVANLLRIYTAMGGGGDEEMAAREMAELGNLEFKERVAERVVEGLKGVRGEILRLRADKGFVEKVLEEGEERAREIAGRTMRDVNRVIGFR
ncbi:Tryptophan--tRNA ligase, mitochondrial [Dinochytrium kinnereticum]|nr:Tryptophan--tRNA ligase, mitochondrial [Dinochytrium kinnereticum]